MMMIDSLQYIQEAPKRKKKQLHNEVPEEEAVTQ
jgi:hypothetical protein